MRIGGSRVDGASWSAGTGWAEGPFFMQYDFVISVELALNWLQRLGRTASMQHHCVSLSDTNMGFRLGQQAHAWWLRVTQYKLVNTLALRCNLVQAVVLHITLTSVLLTLQAAIATATLAMQYSNLETLALWLGIVYLTMWLAHVNSSLTNLETIEPCGGAHV